MCGWGGIPGDSVPVSGPPPDSDLVDLSEHLQLGLLALSRLTCPVSQQHVHCALDPSPSGSRDDDRESVEQHSIFKTIFITSIWTISA